MNLESNLHLSPPPPKENAQIRTYVCNVHSVQFTVTVNFAKIAVLNS